MAATGMPSFGASFAEAAYNRDLCIGLHFSPMSAHLSILGSQAALDASSDNADDRVMRSIFARVNLSKRC